VFETDAVKSPSPVGTRAQGGTARRPRSLASAWHRGPRRAVRGRDRRARVRDRRSTRSRVSRRPSDSPRANDPRGSSTTAYGNVQSPRGSDHRLSAVTVIADRLGVAARLSLFPRGWRVSELFIRARSQTSIGYDSPVSRRRSSCGRRFRGSGGDGRHRPADLPHRRSGQALVDERRGERAYRRPSGTAVPRVHPERPAFAGAHSLRAQGRRRQPDDI
jgi:hypothetical protein